MASPTLLLPPPTDPSPSLYPLPHPPPHFTPLHPPTRQSRLFCPRLPSLHTPTLVSSASSPSSHARFPHVTCPSGRSLPVHRRRTALTVAAVTPSSTPLQEESKQQVLVESLLSLVEGTDRGALLGTEGHAKVAELIAQLEQYCITDPLRSPLIFGEWDVDYSSNPTSSGGYFRSAIGRFFLRTKQMGQNIEAPDNVGNQVAFAAFGVVDGEVSLKGKLKALDTKWIEIIFDPPNLKLGPFKFQFGGISSVKIAIIYVDEVIRLGRGSRGSLFVFKRR